MAANGRKFQPERAPLTLEPHDLDTASDRADWRAAQAHLWLADFECAHGRLGVCDNCNQQGDKP